MRLFFNFVLLACITTSMAAETRHKRHLGYWKSLIMSHFFGSGETTKDLSTILGPPAVLIGNEENFKLYRIPGFDNILIKAIPKAKDDVKTENATSDVSKPTVSILENYLGTKSETDTVKALQGIRDMLQSGVLTAKRESEKVKKPETVFIIPPMTTDDQPIFIRPEAFPIPHLAPAPLVSVQPILPAPITPAFYSSPNSHGVFVTETDKLNAPSVHVVNRFQHMLTRPLLPLPNRMQIPSLLAPKPVMYKTIHPFVNQPTFMEPPRVAPIVPLTPCMNPMCSPVLDRIVVPPMPSYVIKEKVPVVRPVCHQCVKDTLVVPGPPPVIMDRFETIVGGKISSRSSIIEQSKAVKVQPLSSSSQQYTFRVVNKDGSVTTFSKLPGSSNNNVEGYYRTNDGKIFYSRLVENKEVPKDLAGSDETYFQTQDGRIFYSRLVNDHPTYLSTQEGEDSKKHRTHQYTVTSVEEFKNISDRDDVKVTYKNDEDKAFLSYKVPSGSYSYQQVNNFNKDEQKTVQQTAATPAETTTTKKHKATSGKQQNGVKATQLSSGASNYNFKQIHEDGSITEYVGYDASKINIGQTFKNVKGETGNQRYSTNIAAHDKVNEQYVTPNGVKYWRTEIHSIPADVAATLSPTPKLHGNYQPQKGVTSETVMGNYSFKMVNSQMSTESPKNVNVNKRSFSVDNPIIVPDEVNSDTSVKGRGDIPEAFS